MLRMVASSLVAGDVVSGIIRQPIDLTVAEVSRTRSGKSIRVVFTNNDVAYLKPSHLVRVERVQNG